jgi:hypothetical protein
MVHGYLWFMIHGEWFMVNGEWLMFVGWRDEK